MHKTCLKLVFVAFCTTIGTVSALADGKEQINPRQICSNMYKRLADGTRYLCSKAGAKDVAAAYTLGMGLTFIHEFGHALAAKLFYDNPIDITLGTTEPNAPTYARLFGVRLGGFIPATGVAHMKIKLRPRNKSDTLKVAATYIAGPIFGALGSLAAWQLLKKQPKYYIAKAATLYGIFNHTLWVNGLFGITEPGTDPERFVACLSRYLSTKQSSSLP